MQTINDGSDIAGTKKDHAILLFDGVCNLCNRFVNFIINHDSKGYFRMGALQSDEAQPYLKAVDIDPDSPESMVLIENGTVYYESTAALRVARHLSGWWPFLYVLIIVPRPLRDLIYGWIAKNRYDWFGRRNQCRVPNTELDDHFL